MNKKIILWLAFFLTLASASSTLTFFNASSSNYAGGYGVFQNVGGTIIYGRYTDWFNDNSINGTNFVLNQSSSNGFLFENATPSQLSFASAGCGLGYNGNLTIAWDLNNVGIDNLSNFTFYASQGGALTASVMTLRVVDGIPGTQTKYTVVNSTFSTAGTGGNYVLGRMQYNKTSGQIKYYENDVLLSTVTASGYTKVLPQWAVTTCNSQAFNLMVLPPIQVLENGGSIANNFTAQNYYVDYLSSVSGTDSGSLSPFSNWAVNPTGNLTLLFHNKNGYANYTLTSPYLNLSNGNWAFIFSDQVRFNASLFIKVYDEDTLAPFTYALTISNSSNTSNYPAQTLNNFNSTWQGIPNGLISVSYSNNTFYQPRVFATGFNGMPNNLYPSYLNSSLLLLRTQSNASLITFRIVQANGNPVPGAIVQVTRTINGIVYQTGGGITDGVGTVTDYLSTLNTYTITVTASGFSQYITQLAPNQALYTLTLGSGTGGNYSQTFYNTTVTLLPFLNVINVNATGNPDFNVTLTSTDCTLSSYVFQFANSSGLINQQSSTNACGGFLNYTLNVTPYVSASVISSQFNVTVIFYKTGQLPAIIQQTYTVQFTASTGLEDALRNLSAASTPWANALFAIMIALLFTLFFSRYIGFGSGLVTIIVLGVLTNYGFIDPGVFMVAAAVLAALMLTGRFGL